MASYGAQNVSPSSHSHGHSQSPRNSQQYRQSMRHQQRMQQQQQQAYGNATTVPMPPSAIGSQPQYGNNPNINAALHSRQQRAVTVAGHSVHNRALNNMTHFGATPPNSMISPNIRPRVHPQQPSVYQHGGHAGQAMRVNRQTIPLSPTMAQRHSRQASMGNLTASNATPRQRGKRLNNKEIIEL